MIMTVYLLQGTDVVCTIMSKDSESIWMQEKSPHSYFSTILEGISPLTPILCKFKGII